MSGAPQTRTTNGRAEGEEEEGNGKEEASAAASSVAARYLLLLFSSLDSDERGFSRGGAADSGGGAAATAAALAAAVPALLLLPAPRGLTPAACGATACSFRRRASQVLSSWSLAASEISEGAQDGEEHAAGPGEAPEEAEGGTSEAEGGGRGTLTKKTMKHHRPSVETSPRRTAKPQSRSTRAASQPRPVASGQERRTSRRVGSLGWSRTGLRRFRF